VFASDDRAMQKLSEEEGVKQKIEMQMRECYRATNRADG
jgi:hypothetical protein